MPDWSRKNKGVFIAAPVFTNSWVAWEAILSRSTSPPALATLSLVVDRLLHDLQQDILCIDLLSEIGWNNIQQYPTTNVQSNKQYPTTSSWFACSIHQIFGCFTCFFNPPPNPPVPSFNNILLGRSGAFKSSPRWFQRGVPTKLKPLKNHLLHKYRDTSMNFGDSQGSLRHFLSVKNKTHNLGDALLVPDYMTVWRWSKTWSTVIWDLIGLPHQRRASVDDHRILNGIMGHVTVDVPRPTDQETHKKKLGQPEIMGMHQLQSETLQTLFNYIMPASKNPGEPATWIQNPTDIPILNPKLQGEFQKATSYLTDLDFKTKREFLTIPFWKNICHFDSPPKF